MFNPIKRWTEKKDVVETNSVAVMTETDVPKVFTLPEVLTHCVSPNDYDQDSNFTEIDDEIKRNQKLINFLNTEERSGFRNEQFIYREEKQKIEKQNSKMQLRKTEMAKQMEANKAGYSKIDLSFLSMKRPSKGIFSYLPAFSIHRYTGNDFIGCEFEVSRYGLCIENGNFPIGKIAIKHFLTPFIGKVDMDKISISYNASSLTYELDKRVSDRNKTISTFFKGLIPATTKQKVKDAEPIFSGCISARLFLIKECPSWTEREVTKDPLIVGVIGVQAYLIDAFDCTDLEEYVKKEFTE